MKRGKPRRISLLPPGPRIMRVVHYPRGGPSNSTITGEPCTAGTGREFAVEIVEKMPGRGKPPLQNKIRQDQIVAYVRLLREADPTAKMDEAIIKDAANFFHVATRTVWNALRDHGQLDPDKPIPAGPMTFWLHEAD